MRILVAEDSLTQATLMKIALQRKGYEVLLARDGIEAIRMAWQLSPDIVVSDVVMPRLNGYQVCRLLRDDPKTARTPVVLLTSLDQRQDAFWGLKSGADKFITKAGDIDLLVEEIHAFAAARPAAGNGGGAGAGRVGGDADVMERVITCSTGTSSTRRSPRRSRTSSTPSTTCRPPCAGCSASCAGSWTSTPPRCTSAGRRAGRSTS